ncbi:helix-turn-helix domain-containing protein [Nonomuraea polychroma]|uniref:helix-turn-helix domain-containing protein n=1 Tax=Nonomuraea polychroma TaxID=46176 RepID=UPI001F4DB9FA|nr:helix-turn-helix domain-containing protein [Nonomuraea polychroma]
MTDEASPRPRRAPGAPGGTTADSSAAFSVSLERGLRILSAFSGDRSVLGIADLARAVGLNKSTTYRYVATLTKLEYSGRAVDGERHLDPAVRGLSSRGEIHTAER